MKRILIALSLIPTFAFADKIEVTGQFVIAPIATEECNAAAITQPSFGISADSDLSSLLTYFWSDNDANTSISEVSMPKCEYDDIVMIYSPNGQKQNELKRGVNIVVDSKGAARKILVK